MFLLSLCIPTYNRPELLKKSLHSIVSQDYFSISKQVEIVISDNHSSIDTRTVMRDLLEKFPDQIRLYRHEKTISAVANHEFAVRRATGQYLKLVNDSLIWNSGSIEQICNLILSNLKKKPVLFFLNKDSSSQSRTETVRSLDEFVSLVSYRVTWIGGFGVWRSDLDLLTDYGQHADTLLSHVNAVFRNIVNRKAVCILFDKIFEVQKTPERKDYALAKVFGKNYIDFLLRYNNHIEERTIQEEKKRVLLEHILPYYFNPNHNFFLHPLERDLVHFHHENYYRDAVDRARTQWLKTLKQVELTSLASLWRHINAHNHTKLGRACDISVVKVGSYTYGPLNVYSWAHPEERLDIGWFCSIADEVRFILGGEHRQDALMTYPMMVKLGDHYRESECKGGITVKDDVWIGIGATILSGVTVGQGAVVGACAVVSKNVPDYAVVVGNPARVVKYRFPEAVRDVLSSVNLRSLKPSKFRQFQLLYNQITPATLEEVLLKLELSKFELTKSVK
jgi:acetyltransferase-like isoleucine patch superfamily enzyme